jgi:hypothetical protein
MTRRSKRKTKLFGVYFFFGGGTAWQYVCTVLCTISDITRTREKHKVNV